MKKPLKFTNLIPISDFAKSTGISYWLARQLVKNGAIPSIPVGKRRRIDERWIEKWLSMADDSQQQKVG